jgi:hypothetical protein
VSPSPTDKRAPRAVTAVARRPQASTAAKRALRRGPSYQQSRLVLLKRNYMLLAAGVASIVIGFVLLASKEISLSPALLVLGYCVLIPAGFLWEHVPAKEGQGQQPAQGQPGPGGGGE